LIPKICLIGESGAVIVSLIIASVMKRNLYAHSPYNAYFWRRLLLARPITLIAFAGYISLPDNVVKYQPPRPLEEIEADIKTLLEIVLVVHPIEEAHPVPEWPANFLYGNHRRMGRRLARP
jgi:hypothetical protein